jgi:hypothetical protein
MSDAPTTSKSKLAAANDAIQRTKAVFGRYKERTEEIAGNAKEGILIGVATFGLAAGDQMLGEEVVSGIRQHKVGGIPTAAIATGVVVAGTVLGTFGKQGDVGWALAKSSLAEWLAKEGTIAGEKVRLKRDALVSKPETKTGALPAKSASAAEQVQNGAAKEAILVPAQAAAGA